MGCVAGVIRCRRDLSSWLLVGLQNLSKIRIVNVYDQKRFGRQERLAQKANWDTIITDRTILAGDFNAYSPRRNDSLSSARDAGI
jgi:hypothetical protein